MLHRPLRSARTKIAGAGALLGTLLFVSPALAAPTVRNFGCVNATQTSTAPSGATLADVTVTGAGGGNTTTPVWNGTLSATGGKGERIEFTMPVTGGEQFDVVVGCRGHDGAYRPTSSGGFGGGGNGGWNYTTGMYAAGGGGASYVTNLTGETVYGVAGAGGGASGGGTTGEGEDAGGANGGNAQSGGADGGATDDEASGGTGGQGGNGGGLEGTYGLGNLGQSSYPGDSGSSLHGGAGGDSFEFWGGGGGGGGGGASIVTDGEDGSGGGGGGGGAGGVQNGATLVSSTDAANAGDGQVSITYEVAGGVTTSPASHDFGAVTRGSSATHTVTVSNPGDAPVSLGQMAVAGVDADDFSLAADTCSNQPLASAGSCTVNVTFTPAASGARSAALQIPSSASGSPTAVALWGTGQATATLPAPTGDAANAARKADRAASHRRHAELERGPLVLGLLLPTGEAVVQGQPHSEAAPDAPGPSARPVAQGRGRCPCRKAGSDQHAHRRPLARPDAARPRAAADGPGAARRRALRQDDLLARGHARVSHSKVNVASCATHHRALRAVSS